MLMQFGISEGVMIMPSTTFNLPGPLHHIHCRDCGRPGHASCGQGRFENKWNDPIINPVDPIKPINIEPIKIDPIIPPELPKTFDIFDNQKTCIHGNKGYCILCGK